MCDISSISGYARGTQHKTAIDEPSEHGSNAFAKHSIAEHKGEKKIDYKVDIIRSYRRPLERQIREGIEIVRTETDILLNSKLDHFQPGLRRMTFESIFDE